ncbi:pilus assembly protein TadG-related protein [Mesobacterium pallidum]|uniref:pilus assembly protein TadG-related protein n=1 Tax=Mesobacterium pallidum TaxID=2872037 RepID=UPI001EE3225A|nr:pilus assembly protein TadG-related protein [Mesobacterium pallidum]
MKFMISDISDPIRSEDGWVSVASIFWIMGILAVGGVAIDYSNAQMAQNRLKAATDAAALAAVQDLPDRAAARKTVRDSIEANMPAEKYGNVSKIADIQFGSWDADTRSMDWDVSSPDAVRVVARHTDGMGYSGKLAPLISQIIGFDGWEIEEGSIAVKPESCTAEKGAMGDMTGYLLFVADGSVDANWQGATKGFIGDTAVNGLVTKDRSSGGVPYDGTIYTNAPQLTGWDGIVAQNTGTAWTSPNETARIDDLMTVFNNALSKFGAMDPTPGFENVAAADLDGMNSQNGTAETFVINITSGMSLSSSLNISGDATDLYVLRWDEDPYRSGFQGTVKLSSGGGVNPMGKLEPTNFINLAGNINASGGGAGQHESSGIVGDLGCSVFAFQGGTSIVNSSTRLTGNLCYARDVVSLTNQKAEDFTGSVMADSTMMFAYTEKNFLPTGGIHIGKHDVQLAREDARLKQLSADLLTETPNFVLPDPLVSSATVTADPGKVTVVNLTGLDLNGATLTLDGAGTYVFNFTGDTGTFDWSNTQIRLLNGATAESIFWNFKGAYDIVVNKESNVFRGHILAPNGSVIYHNPADFDGSIAALNVNLHSMFDLEGLPRMLSNGQVGQPSGLAKHLAKLQGDVGGGGFFTGYWLTTGDPDKGYESSALSNAIFVGGWYTSATKFSMTSGTSGVYVPPPPVLATPSTCSATESMTMLVR